MAMNPYEMRWEFLQQAQTRLESQLTHNVERWVQMKELHESKGIPMDMPYPSYPTAEEIHAVAEEMRRFVENQGV